MSDNNSPSQLPAILEKPQTLLETIRDTVPTLQKRHDLAVEAMEKMTKPNSEEEYEANNRLLVRIKKTYDLAYAERIAITKQLDEIYEYLMQFERPLNYDTKAKSLYNEVRKLQQQYLDEKLTRVKAEEAKAAQRKAIEDHKVEVTTQIRTNLSNLIVTLITKLTSWSATFFDKATMETFADFEKRFRSVKPRLPQSDYDKAFEVSYNKTLVEEGAFHALCESLQKEESYKKWDDVLQDKMMPLLNEWHANIPTIKQRIHARQTAKSEEERQRIEAEQAAVKAREEAERQAAIEKVQTEQAAQIAEREQIDKLSNEFAQQASLQEIESAGPTKKVLKFVDPADPTPLVHIIYTVFAEKKFSGILKKDKSGKNVLDDKQRPEYITPVQWFVDQYLKLCDLQKFKIEKTVIFDDAKVIVRK